jgi:hypothetical protein
MNTSVESTLLRPGDRVVVATRFGDGPIEEHTILAIVDTLNSPADPPDLPAVLWADLTDRAIVVDLDNGTWAYGYQLARPAPSDARE